MTLTSVLNHYSDKDLGALSIRVREAAVRCGQEMKHSKEISFNDWSVIDDMAESILEVDTSDLNRVAIFFEFFERFPSFHVLTIMFRWYDDHPSLSNAANSEIWKRFGILLGSDAEFADPIAYTLWVDRFEDPGTVKNTWDHLFPACVSDKAIDRLLEISGPVPFDIKQPLYIRLFPDANRHNAILKSLYFSAIDVFGQFDRERAYGIRHIKAIKSGSRIQRIHGIGKNAEFLIKVSLQAMSEIWKIEANQRFPELREQFEDCDTPYLLWFELRDAFSKAYSESPRDENTIRRIYEYADWCCQQPQTDSAKEDLVTCVAVTFYEHIPESPAAMADMPRWFTLDDVRRMQGVFSYHIGNAGFQKILNTYGQRKNFSRKASR